MSLPIVVIQGASSINELPGLEQIQSEAELRFAPDVDTLREAIYGAQALFSWNFKDTQLKDVWDQAASLKWIHWGGAGVNSALFPELANSSVALTNSRGIFDAAMSEYVLGMILIMAKQLDKVLQSQQENHWQYRLSESIAGKNALVVGAGSIGRAIGRRLKANQMNIRAIGRSARSVDDDFEEYLGTSDLHSELPWADYVILVTPLTSETYGLFGQPAFAQMKNSARFINVGRGPCVDESAMIEALKNNKIAGAALDVFETEPLPADNPLWSLPNVMVTPHVSGDFKGFKEAMVNQFLRNYKRYKNNDQLINIVNKQRGY